MAKPSGKADSQGNSTNDTANGRQEAKDKVNRFFSGSNQPLTGIILATQNDPDIFALIQNYSYLEELTYLFDLCKFPLFQNEPNVFDPSLYSKVVIEFSRKLQIDADDLPGIVFFDNATIEAGQFVYLKLQDFSTPEALRVMRDLSDFLQHEKDWSVGTIASYNRNKGMFFQRRTEGPKADMRNVDAGKIKSSIEDFIVNLAIKVVVAVAKNQAT